MGDSQLGRGRPHQPQAGGTFAEASVERSRREPGFRGERERRGNEWAAPLRTRTRRRNGEVVVTRESSGQGRRGEIWTSVSASGEKPIERD